MQSNAGDHSGGRGRDNNSHSRVVYNNKCTSYRKTLPLEAYPSTTSSSSSSSMLQLSRHYYHKLFGSTFFEGFSFVISGTKNEEFK